MGRRSQRKGKRGEQEDVRALLDLGIRARRTAALQAGLGRQSDVPDIQWGPDLEYSAECKHRAKGHTTLYNDLGGADLLLIRADNRVRLWVFPDAMARIVVGGWWEAVQAMEAGP